MSVKFQGVIRDILLVHKEGYVADVVALIPGVGTFLMEAMARQIAVDRRVVVLLNLWLVGWLAFLPLVANL